ncbi:S-layer homology domain-containing protein [Paenibacillus beijingensis]|uniref:SLH domain-containing protein n=1 Tax=Paenibacillus beijingensis TaxID=1126833 RepID=A0A0D5NGP4_9BACL|nr:S-layer homology domain-containing protein [Paenibacillus beijingensis]AJY74093.1 hypothetical protein VN24_05095 [Paenibacillus beijingensis]
MPDQQLRKTLIRVPAAAMLLLAILPAAVFGAAEPFKDSSNSYAKQEIASLTQSGMISGYGDGTFQPKKEMTRAELAKIIVKSMGVSEQPEMAASFKDVKPDCWCVGYIGALVAMGITKGTSETEFSPEAPITRQELVVFFIRAFGLEDAAENIKKKANLSDMKDVSKYALNDVSLAYQIGFVNGIENADGSLRFDPNEYAERQALARLAYEFITNKPAYLDKAATLTGGKTGSDE